MLVPYTTILSCLWICEDSLEKRLIGPHIIFPVFILILKLSAEIFIWDLACGNILFDHFASSKMGYY